MRRAVIKQCDRLQFEQSSVGGKALLAGRGNGRKSTPPPPLFIAVLYAHAQVAELKDAENMSSSKWTNILTVNRVVTATTTGTTTIAPVAPPIIGSTYKRHGTKGGGDANGGYKLIRAGCH